MQETSSTPDPGGSHMLHSTMLWSLGATATDRTHRNHESSSPLGAHALQQEKPLQWEARTPRQREDPLATVREKPAQQQRLNTVKNK